MRTLIVAALLFPAAAFADGGNDSPPPKPAVTCEGSKVYDKKTKSCVDAQESNLDRDTLYQAVRQLAYAERYVDAQGVLAAMPAQDPGRLTYMGFTARKLGQADLAMKYYNEAIALDPANILARSYMGQGHVEAGDIDLALVQLEEIRAHGGAGSWSETSLRNAIATGTTYRY